MPISLPRIARISRMPSGTRSRPCHRILPSAMRPGGMAISFSTDIAVTVLPQPLSPTIPSVSPRSSARSTPLTACTTPPSVSKYVLSPRISSRRWPLVSGNSEYCAWVEGVAQPIADEIDRQHGKEDRAAGTQRPMRRDVEIVLGIVEDAPPARDVGREAEAEKRQGRLGDDRGRDIDGCSDDHRP